MVELTVEITNRCLNKCPWCSSDAIPDGKHLDYGAIENFLLSYDASEIERINISGGEPLSHPDFYKILLLCNRLCSNVWVYTNAIKNLAYNTHVLKEVNVKANVCLVPNTEVYVPKGSFHVSLLKFIPQGRGRNIQPIDYHFSGNITGKCKECNNPTLLADGRVVPAPCQKDKAKRDADA